MVNHSILLQKLEKMFGFRGSALSFMESYLTNRLQYTKIGDSKSRKQLIGCGVPQGSSLGPLLFLLYANDFPQMSQLSTTLFADDSLLSLSDANLTRLENRVNTQLQYIVQWLNQNKLTLNYFKTTYLLFNKQLHGLISLKFLLKINQKEISRSESVKYLGVWFDDKLNWSAHIQKLSLQLSRCCNMLLHMRDFVNAHALVKLYYSFVYSRLTYGITAWGTAAQNQLREIEVKLNNIIRTMT